MGKPNLCVLSQRQICEGQAAYLETEYGAREERLLQLSQQQNEEECLEENLQKFVERYKSSNQATKKVMVIEAAKHIRILHNVLRQRSVLDPSIPMEWTQLAILAQVGDQIQKDCLTLLATSLSESILRANHAPVLLYLTESSLYLQLSCDMSSGNINKCAWLLSIKVGELVATHLLYHQLTSYLQVQVHTKENLSNYLSFASGYLLSILNQPRACLGVRYLMDVAKQIVKDEEQAVLDSRQKAGIRFVCQCVSVYRLVVRDKGCLPPITELSGSHLLCERPWGPLHLLGCRILGEVARKSIYGLQALHHACTLEIQTQKDIDSSDLSENIDIPDDQNEDCENLIVYCQCLADVVRTGLNSAVRKMALRGKDLGKMGPNACVLGENRNLRMFKMASDKQINNASVLTGGHHVSTSTLPQCHTLRCRNPSPYAASITEKLRQDSTLQTNYDSQEYRDRNVVQFTLDKHAEISGNSDASHPTKENKSFLDMIKSVDVSLANKRPTSLFALASFSFPRNWSWRVRHAAVEALVGLYQSMKEDVNRKELQECIWRYVLFCKRQEKHPLVQRALSLLQEPLLWKTALAPGCSMPRIYRVVARDLMRFLDELQSFPREASQENRGWINMVTTRDLQRKLDRPQHDSAKQLQPWRSSHEIVGGPKLGNTCSGPDTDPGQDTLLLCEHNVSLNQKHVAFDKACGGTSVWMMKSDTEAENKLKFSDKHNTEKMEYKKNSSVSQISETLQFINSTTSRSCVPAASSSETGNRRRSENTMGKNPRPQGLYKKLELQLKNILLDQMMNYPELRPYDDV